MKKSDVIFETKLSIKVILIYSILSIAISIGGLRTLKYNDYSILIIFIIISILIYCYRLKKYQLTEKEIIILRPLWFSAVKKIPLDKILKIEFWFSRTKLSAGLRMLIQTRHETKNYSFYCSKEEAKEFIIELKKLNIKVELDEYFANLLEK